MQKLLDEIEDYYYDETTPDYDYLEYPAEETTTETTTSTTTTTEAARRRRPKAQVREL